MVKPALEQDSYHPKIHAFHHYALVRHPVDSSLGKDLKSEILSRMLLMMFMDIRERMTGILEKGRVHINLECGIWLQTRIITIFNRKKLEMGLFTSFVGYEVYIHIELESCTPTIIIS